MRNFITFFLIGLFLIPYSLLLGVVYLFSKKASKKMADFCAKKVSIGVFDILYKVDQFMFFGYEESKNILPPQFMILCNHQSLFDIPALLRFMPELDLRFIAKDALGKGVPLVSPMLKSQEHCLIPRNVRPIDSIKLIADFGKRSKEQNLVPVLFPEGTRSRDGNLRNFYSAGFRTLTEASQLPVVVCVIDGGWKIADLKGLFKNIHKGSYRLKILKVFPCPNGKEECKKVLDESRALMEAQLIEWRKKPLTER